LRSLPLYLQPSRLTYTASILERTGVYLNYGNAEIQDLRVVKFLVEIGKADVDLLLETGFFGSALIAAVESEGVDAVRYLVVEAKENVNRRIQDPLYNHSAREATIFPRSDIEIIKILVLEGGADVDLQIQNEYGSILSYAVYYSSRVGDIIVFLVQDRGVDINMQIENGRYGSALTVAVSSQSRKKVPAMIRLGADVNMQIKHGPYGSALAVAAASSPAKLEILVNAGAMVDMQIENGWIHTGSALATAVLARIPSSTKRLLKLGADVNMQIKHGPYGSAPAAAAAASSYSLESVEILVEAGANVNMPLENGEYTSALEAAAAYANIDVLEYLIQVGADVGMWGARALRAVRETLQDKATKELAAKLLLEAGAKDVTEEQLSAGVSGVSTLM
jgi:ankyrin repeat protein